MSCQKLVSKYQKHTFALGSDVTLTHVAYHYSSKAHIQIQIVPYSRPTVVLVLVAVVIIVMIVILIVVVVVICNLTIR